MDYAGCVQQQKSMSHIVVLFLSVQPVGSPLFFRGVYPVVEIMNIAIAYGFSEDNNFDKSDINRCKLEYFFLLSSVKLKHYSNTLN